MKDLILLLLSVLMIVHLRWLHKRDKEYVELGSYNNSNNYYSQICDVEKRMEKEQSREQKIIKEKKQLEDQKYMLQKEINHLENWIKDNSIKEAL